MKIIALLRADLSKRCTFERRQPGDYQTFCIFQHSWIRYGGWTEWALSFENKTSALSQGFTLAAGPFFCALRCEASGTHATCAFPSRTVLPALEMHGTGPLLRRRTRLCCGGGFFICAGSRIFFEFLLARLRAEVVRRALTRRRSRSVLFSNRHSANRSSDFHGSFPFPARWGSRRSAAGPLTRRPQIGAFSGGQGNTAAPQGRPWPLLPRR